MFAYVGGSAVLGSRRGTSVRRCVPEGRGLQRRGTLYSTWRVHLALRCLQPLLSQLLEGYDPAFPYGQAVHLPERGAKGWFAPGLPRCLRPRREGPVRGRKAWVGTSKFVPGSDVLHDGRLRAPVPMPMKGLLVPALGGCESRQTVRTSTELLRMSPLFWAPGGVHVDQRVLGNSWKARTSKSRLYRGHLHIHERGVTSHTHIKGVNYCHYGPWSGDPPSAADPPLTDHTLLRTRSVIHPRRPSPPLRTR